MADVPKIPEQFYKSRLACFTFSTLAFAASVVSDANLDQMKIFGIEGRSVDHKFLVLALIVAAGVSLASVVLLYIDDVAKFMRYSVGPQPSRSMEEISEDARKVMSELSGHTAALRKMLENPEINDLIAAGPTTLRNDEASRIVESLQQITPLQVILQQINSLASSTLTFAAAREAAESEAAKSEVAAFRADIIYSIEQVRENVDRAVESALLQFKDPRFRTFWDGPSLDQLKNQINSYVDLNRSGVERLVSELDRYNRIVRRANQARRLEYFAIGVGAPAALFGIAAAHCWGRLFGGHFPDLPTWVNLYIF